MDRYNYTNLNEEQAKMTAEFYEVSQTIYNECDEIVLYEVNHISRLEYLVKIIKKLHRLNVRNICNNIEHLVRMITPMEYIMKNSNGSYDEDIKFIRLYIIEYLKTGKFLGLTVNNSFNIVVNGINPLNSYSTVKYYYDIIDKLTLNDIIDLLNSEFNDEKYY